MRAVTKRTIRSEHLDAIRARGRDRAFVVDERYPGHLALIDSDLVAAVHRYGGKVVSTVTTVAPRAQAEASGADALIATGHEP